MVSRYGLWTMDYRLLLEGRTDQLAKQRVRLQRPGLELRMILAGDKPGVRGEFNHLGQVGVLVHAGDDQALRRARLAIAVV